MRSLLMPHNDAIWVGGIECIQAFAVGGGSATWPLANLGLFVPFVCWENFPINYLATINGSAVSGNICIGVYAEDGTIIATSGRVAQSGTNTIQTMSPAYSGVSLARGNKYYFAMSMDNTTGTNNRMQFASAALMNVARVMQMENAYPLPARATLVDATYHHIPAVAIGRRAL